MTNTIRLEELDKSGDIRQAADDAGAYDPNGTRRELLRKAGIGGAGVFAGGMLTGLISPLDAFASASKSQKGAYSTSRSKSIKRGAINANDVKIGNYALTLEYLEAAFYAAAAKAGYQDVDIAQAATILAKHEAAHVSALKSVLKKAAVKAPTLNLDAVGAALANQETFILTASMLEPVGTAAYGGAGPYIQNLGIVKAALSIHSVEANHAAYTAHICAVKGIAGAPSPVAHTFNPPASFTQTVKKVTATKFVKGDLQP